MHSIIVKYDIASIRQINGQPKVCESADRLLIIIPSCFGWFWSSSPKASKGCFNDGDIFPIFCSFFCSFFPSFLPCKCHQPSRALLTPDRWQATAQRLTLQSKFCHTCQYPTVIATLLVNDDVRDSGGGMGGLSLHKPTFRLQQEHGLSNENFIAVSGNHIKCTFLKYLE